jgi:Protein of unknown function (DUF3618)
VAASRDPDAIVHEIEQTRAELADAIDKIVAQVSPKRVASRAGEAIQTPTGRLVAIGAAVLVLAVVLMKRRSR